jgi:methylated-DNA-[protein]-cysteine S-methyltransferase
MQKVTKYVIFKTKWGYFGLAGTEYALCRACLPATEANEVKIRLVGKSPGVKFDRAYFSSIQQQIIAYFEGVRVDFGFDVSLSLDGFSDFQKAALTACRSIKFGQTITYGELAKKLSRPAAARAVGNALAKNPLPFIIPCHRIIRNDGSLGGFSAPGGKDTKVRLLRHEKATLATYKNG